MTTKRVKRDLVSENMSLVERVCEAEEQRDRCQKAATEAIERARAAETRLAELDLFRFAEVAAAVRKAEAHGAFTDLNHVFGVLYEELVIEFASEVHRNHSARARLELYDIAGAAIKAIAQIERNDL